MATNIRSGMPAVTQPTRTTARAQTAAPARSTVSQAMQADTFTPAATDPNAKMDPSKMNSLQKTAYDLLGKASGDTASQLKDLMAKSYLTADDVTKMCELYAQLKDNPPDGMSSDDVGKIGAGVNNRMVMKGFSDWVLATLKDMGQQKLFDQWP